jgi:hypothetical protein
MLNNGFQGLPISEVVPEAVAGMQEGLTKSSLLVSRRKIRFQPQTGTTASPNGIVQFVLADSSSLLDVNSATISFTVTTNSAGSASAPAALDDGPSIFRRVQTSLNGNLVSDVDHAHRLCNMEVYASADRSWYQSAAGGFAGYWKFNPDLSTGVYPVTTGAAVGGAYNPAFGDIAGDITAVGTSTGTWFSAGTRHAAGEQRLVPLSLLDGFFRCKQYVPLNLLGELVVSFTLASNEEAFLNFSSTSGTYSLSDIFMECDVVQPHYALNEIMQKQANSEGENGIVIPYEAAIVSQGQAITSGTSSVIVSRATNNLRRCLYAQQLTSGLSIQTFPSVSCFGFNSTSNWQVRCGSLYFPSQPATTAARMYGLLTSSYGDAVNDKPGIMNRLTYTQTSATIASTPLKLCYTDNFIVGYGFDAYKNTAGTNVLDADGLSVLGMAGSQVVFQVSQTGSVSPIVALMATRYLSLQNGTLKIVGV